MRGNAIPWKFLDEYRGSHFQGEWPTLPELFSISTERYPERRCFSIYDPDNLFLNYGESLAAIKGVSNYLVRNGVKKGDRVAVTGKNSPEWAIAYLAVLFAGGVVVPIDYQLHTKDVAGLIEFSDAKIAFIDEEKFEEIDNEKNIKLQNKISLSPRKEN